MQVDDPYGELGLRPGAADEAVKAAWRRLVSQWHPDRNASAEAADRVKRFNIAYEQIVQARQAGGSADAADAAAGRAPRRGAKPHRPDHGFEGGAQADPGSDERGFHSRPRRRQLPRTVRVSLEGAIRGCVRELRGRITATCGRCLTQGWIDMGQTCAACDGVGTQRVKPLFAWLTREIRCAECEGSGRLRIPCPECQGAGRRKIDYRQQVRLPAGLRDGDRLDADAGRQGDVELTLNLVVEVEPHPFFRREADGTLRCEIPVDGFAWLAEAWLDVPTPDGLLQIRLRRTARTYRLRGHGAPPRPGSPRADLILTVTPSFPETLEPATQQLLDRLAESTATSAPAPAVAEWRRTLETWAQPPRPEKKPRRTRSGATR
jgi:molecular chaperone DnaJ